MNNSVYHASVFLTFIVLSISRFSLVYGQDTTRSSVFKDYRPPNSTQLIRASDIEYQLWEGFMVVHKANEGDPAAQQELGLRYFLGKGFPADTTKAAYWIEKAARQNMSIAQYNFGVFLDNGWGVKWNPFEAYRWFKTAADYHLPEAEFVMGLFYTDNLVVARDWVEAYNYVKAAADANYEPARKVLQEFINRGITVSNEAASMPPRDSSSARVSAESFSSVEPVYIDFGKDTTTHVDDLTLLNEAFHQGDEEFRKALGVSRMFEPQGDTTGIGIIERAAQSGIPEALAVLGRCYEKGVGVPRDRILAAEQYLRAARLDSRRAPLLLLNLVREKTFPEEVEARTRKNDDDAAFVWAGLVELGLDQRILQEQAFHLLVVAADHGNIPSLIELGRCYFTGQWTKQNPALGNQCWKRAVMEGSRDAQIRLSAAEILSDSSGLNSDSVLPIARDIGDKDHVEKAVRTLVVASDEGSLIGQLALGYCYEHGIGEPQNTAEAVRLYRNCAQRGSRSAYDSLKRLYDQLRPSDKEFDVSGVNGD
ncbi:MAG TPA: tetratricopeptide repeat protein [Candidatus Acidoferrales bacterium]|nr:tetratricopeptide repeat protein [Candidatus Acidoferrales bacterium]